MTNRSRCTIFLMCRTSRFSTFSHPQCPAPPPPFPRVSPKRTQIWAPLIEKAFAKLHGCYESLGRGSIEQGLRCLTGAPVLRTPLMLSSKQHSEQRTVSGTVNCEESEKHRQELWTKMKKWVAVTVVIYGCMGALNLGERMGCCCEMSALIKYTRRKKTYGQIPCLIRVIVCGAVQLLGYDRSTRWTLRGRNNQRTIDIYYRERRAVQEIFISTHCILPFPVMERLFLLLP